MMEQMNKDSFAEFIENASKLMKQNKEYLISLDAALGDGDLGLTMSIGFQAADDLMKNCVEKDIGKILMKIGMTFAQTVPSTMGTLIASGFMAAGKKGKGKTEYRASELAEFAGSFLQGIIDRGRAEPGGRTIIDALYPAAQAVAKAAEEGESLSTCCKNGLEAARVGVEATKKMLPTFGRAVYYGEKALGKPDQGAIVGMLIYQALCETICSQ